MKKINQELKNISGGWKIKNNAIFAFALGTGVVSSVIDEAFDIAANRVLEERGFNASYNHQTAFMRFSPDASKSAILF